MKNLIDDEAYCEIVKAENQIKTQCRIISTTVTNCFPLHFQNEGAAIDKAVGDILEAMARRKERQERMVAGMK